VISNVEFSASGSGDSQTFTTAIYLNPSESTGPITNSCMSSSGSTPSPKPCSCKFDWNEINDSSGSSSPIPHTVYSSLATVQSSLVTCPGPVYYETEIPNGTTINISIVPSGANVETFSITPYEYLKRPGSSTTGSFTDAQGNVFDNILRYSCYQQFKKGTDIISRKKKITNPSDGATVDMVMASQFCVAGKSSGTGCETVPESQNSAQANYYNLFIPDSRKGEINSQNANYVCPRVKESLRGSSTIGDQGEFWPLDTSFSLSVAKTVDYTIGVEAYATLNIGNEASSQSTSCSGETIENAAGGLVKKCLGFAAKTNSDGTCPSIRDTENRIHQTYRLRRYIAVYPPIYDADGKMSVKQSVDSIYVADRPVSSLNATQSKPYTMLGPKPCPFAYFDHKGVIATDGDYADNDSKRPGYYATNDADGTRHRPGYYTLSGVGWDGKNVDGLYFPNQDVGGSCSAAFPIFNSSTNTWSIATSHSTNATSIYQKVFVRPMEPWAPHYVEDTSFEACAPQSWPQLLDPPLHFAKDSDGNVGWCAEVYPSQNPNISAVDKVNDAGTIVGKVLPFTSHVVKNSMSPKCTNTSLSIPSNYAAAVASCLRVGDGSGNDCDRQCSYTGVARHPSLLFMEEATVSSGCSSTYGGDERDGSCYLCAGLTCDRTVQSTTVSWAKYPLLAPAIDIEAAIKADIKSYGCLITYDNKSGKTGKASPKQGCCGTNVKVYTCATTGSEDECRNDNAHLEPTAPCLVPSYE